ncbi:MAG: hypothetical protein V4691_03910 [Pseudomonadota bacterium]
MVVEIQSGMPLSSQSGVPQNSPFMNIARQQANTSNTDPASKDAVAVNEAKEEFRKMAFNLQAYTPAERRRIINAYVDSIFDSTGNRFLSRKEYDTCFRLKDASGKEWATGYLFGAADRSNDAGTSDDQVSCEEAKNYLVEVYNTEPQNITIDSNNTAAVNQENLNPARREESVDKTEPSEEEKGLAKLLDESLVDSEYGSLDGLKNKSELAKGRMLGGLSKEEVFRNMLSRLEKRGINNYTFPWLNSFLQTWVNRNYDPSSF